MSKSIKIKLIKRGKGFDNVHFTPEEKALVKQQTNADVVIGNNKRAQYQNLGVNTSDYDSLVNTENGLNSAVLLSKINKLSEVKRFKSIQNKQLLNELVKAIPDLDEVALPVLKMIIDNKPADLNDEDSVEFYTLSDIIMKNPSLKSLFKPTDLVLMYNNTQEASDIVDIITQQTGQMVDNQVRLKKHEQEAFKKLHELTDHPTDRFKAFSEVKKIVPDLQEQYNVAHGHRAKQNITNLGRDKITEVIDFEPRVDKILKSEADIAQLTADMDAIDKEVQDVQTPEFRKIKAEMADLKIKVEADVDAFNALTDSSQGYTPQEIENLRDKLTDQLANKVIVGAKKRDKAKSNILWCKQQLDKYNPIIARIETKQIKYAELEKELKIRHDRIEDLNTQFNDIKEQKEVLQTEHVGLGLSKPKSWHHKRATSPYGRLKNGKPRKNPPKNKDPTKYHPRNRLHWIQKKDKDANGRVVFSGGVMNLDEMIETLLNVRNTGQQVKAISMLDSLADSLPKKQYDIIYKMLIE